MQNPILLETLINQFTASLTEEELQYLEKLPVEWNGKHAKGVLNPEVRSINLNWVELEEIIDGGKFPGLNKTLLYAIEQTRNDRKYDRDDGILYYPWNLDVEVLPEYDCMSEGDHYWIQKMKEDLGRYKPKAERKTNAPANSGWDHW